MAAAGAATASLVSRAVGAIIITVLLLNPRRIIFYDKLHKPETREAVAAPAAAIWKP